MEDEKAKKLQYINENLIEKGYNPEELSNFIIRKLGLPMENINFEKLKEMIEEFKDQSLQDTYKSVKSKNKEKKQNPFDILYSPQSFDIKTQLQQNNKLLELDKDNYLINVLVSDPKKEKSGGFFSKALYSYKVVCPELKTDIRRTYEDFEWFRKQINNRYSLRLTPPILKESIFSQLDTHKQESGETIELRKVKYLNHFMKSLLQRKIFRTSPILYEFLELSPESFKKYKDLIEKNKYELSIMLDNLKTNKGKIHCEIKKEDIKKADNFNKKYNNLSAIYTKLDKNIANVVSDFQSLEIHMKELGEQFNKLSEELKDIEAAKNLENIYSQFSTIFTNWSFSYSKQSLFFKDDFKTLFNYMNLEVQEMDSIYKDYLSFKNEYEDFTTRINKKKEELFSQKDYSKWSLEPGTEKQLPTFQNNKKIAFEKMLYRETFLLGEEKKRVACVIYMLFKQFDRLLNHQSDNLIQYFDKMKENNSTIIGDAHNLINLFSISKK